ncbi:apolipoprotein N-acyltransferase [Haliangium ochraceum]|uniref:Apolipoprotein N-acyltransferase n=1 Tax=Haliangium ochraceum (strain DSM 14365 / JCM 11303 / SMP-2) TaxID=502025 RepID=D0LGX0_HALO1|nr:apolipoprotein N-acyltransferase [Haliangium ochraceum]ACY14692.1 apolipoprotein N-acyltransferase [Haliangium ochraceum DSM 14365]
MAHTPRWILLTLSVLSGLSWVVAGPDVDVWPLAYVGLVPLLVAVERARSTRQAALCGWVAGLVANVLGFAWIIELLTRHAAMPGLLGALALLLLAAYQALVFMLFAAAVRGLRERSRARGAAWPLWALAPACMVAFEFLVPFLFPWYLAISQAWVPPMIQLAEFTGPLGVTAVIALVNGGLGDALLGPSRRRRVLGGVAAALALVGALGFGTWRMAAIDEARAQAPTLRVGVVQTHVPMNSPPAGADQLAALQAASAELDAAGAELLVWPESSYPYALPRAMAADAAPESPYRVRDGFDAPVIFGAVTRAPERERPPWNSALMLDQSGRVTGRYDKMHLLLFGEYIPLLDTFPSLRALLPEAASHFARGQAVTSFPLRVGERDLRLGPLICYEDILPRFGRTLAAEHPHLLVNLTNDAWFGDSAEPWQHLALSVLRAVELRADMVRAVNPGVSAFIDASGRVRAQTFSLDPAREQRPPATLLVDAALLEGGHTFYARAGDWLGYLCALAVLGAWLLWPALTRRRA